MPTILKRLNVLATWLLVGVLACVLAARIWPGVRALAGVGPGEHTLSWPETLQVYPPHQADPVRLVRIVKDGQPIVPGTYRMPQIVGPTHQIDDAVEEWLRNVALTLKSQTSKLIVSVGIGVVFAARDTRLTCDSLSGLAGHAHDPNCDHSHWCDGGCPDLIDNTLHWGLLPAVTAAALQARYAPDLRTARRVLLEGKEPLRLDPGGEITLSAAGRADGMLTHTDLRHGFADTLGNIVYTEGIDELGMTPPPAEAANSGTRRTLSYVSKFNVSIDVVYFEDGTRWANYGYGYASPNSDGTFTRLDAEEPPETSGPPSGPE